MGLLCFQIHLESRNHPSTEITPAMRPRRPPQELEFSEQNSSAAMDSVRSVHPSDVSWGVDPGTL